MIDSADRPCRLKAWAGRLILAAQDLLWPPVCSVCPRPLPLEPDPLDPLAYFCPECLSGVEMMAAAVCPVCGRPFYNAPNGAMRRRTALRTELFVREQSLEAAGLSGGHVCGDCLVDPPPYNRARSAAVYQGGVSRSIALLKYGGELHQVRALRALAGEALLSALPPGTRGAAGDHYELILPLPISKRRLAERGFNQAAELARAIYRPWASLIDERALVRTGGEIHQAALSGSKRRQAIRGCFEVPDPNRVRGARILLFDDVLTTGATAGEAASTLLAAGARQVDLATIARTVLDSWR